MPIRRLIHYFANNERLINKLSESYPVRRAAQLTVAWFYKGQETLSKVDPQKVNFIISLLRRFSSNLKNGIADAKKQLKK